MAYNKCVGHTCVCCGMVLCIFLLVLCSVQRVLALALRFFTVYSLVKSGLIVTLYGFHGLAGIEMVSRYI